VSTDHGLVALVLAGGAGTRLRPVVADRPKPLAPVDGQPFLDHVLQQLADAGVRRAVLCTGHLGDRFEREYGRRFGEMEIVCAREAEPLGTAGALRAALPQVDSEAVLVLNGDSYCDVPLARFAAEAAAANTPMLVAVDVADTARFGRLQLAADGRVLAFAEKQQADPGPGPINAGIYWLPRGVLERLPATAPLSLERDVLPGLVASGLRAFRTDGAFLDIGTPESYAAASGFFSRLAARAAGGRGLLVLDRDGTLIAEKHYLADPAGVELLPGVVEGLRRFAANGYALAVVTNQSGIGRGYFDEHALTAVHAEMCAQLQRAGIAVHGIWHCPHRPEDQCGCRKPAPGLMVAALRELGYTPQQCLVVGDKPCDIELGRALGARTALVRTGYGAATEREGSCRPDVVVDSLAQLSLQVSPLEVGA
jgi:histidinol-phosphate phosphatase family protein